MEGLLTVFVAITAVAIVTQAGVLVGIYIMSKRLSEQVERFMQETREMMVPVRSIAENLRLASANLVEIGLSARDQFRRIGFDRVSQTIIDRINETADVVQDSVVRPAREVAAIAKGLSRGFGALLFRKTRSTVDQARQDEELFI